MEIVKMQEKHRAEVLEMMRTFYTSPAVSTDGSEEIYERDIDHCVNDFPYLKGYVFVIDGTVCGYAMVAPGYTTEVAKPCLWVEDLYMKADFRGNGIGKQFFRYLEEQYPDTALKLEVEPENVRAVQMYERNGFIMLPYGCMVRCGEKE